MKTEKNLGKHSFKLSKKNKAKLEKMIDVAKGKDKSIEEVMVSEVISGDTKIYDMVNTFDYLIEDESFLNTKRSLHFEEEMLSFIDNLDSFINPLNKKIVKEVEGKHKNFLKDDVLTGIVNKIEEENRKRIRKSGWIVSSSLTVDTLQNRFVRHAIEEGTSMEEIIRRNIVLGRVQDFHDLNKLLNFIKKYSKENKDYFSFKRNKKLYDLFVSFLEERFKFSFSPNTITSEEHKPREKRLFKKLVKACKEWDKN